MEPVYFAPNIQIQFDYTNYKGEFGHRKAEVRYIFYGYNSFHGMVAQWFMNCVDLDKNVGRDFAMKDMSNVRSLTAD